MTETPLSDQFIDAVINELERWRTGELRNREANAMMDAMDWFLNMQRRHLHELRDSRRVGEEDTALEANIARASEQHDAMVNMWNGLLDGVRARKGERRTQAKRQDLKKTLTHSTACWTRPDPVAAGLQAMLLECCDCGLTHIMEFRISDNFVEYRGIGEEDRDQHRAT